MTGFASCVLARWGSHIRAIKGNGCPELHVDQFESLKQEIWHKKGNAFRPRHDPSYEVLLILVSSYIARAEVYKTDKARAMEIVEHVTELREMNRNSVVDYTDVIRRLDEESDEIQARMRAY